MGPLSFDLARHLQRQSAFSQRTFGPGNRTAGVLDHIRKELVEIEQAPDDLEEWQGRGGTKHRNRSSGLA